MAERGGGRTGRVPLYLESGPRRVFACAIDWPGWCRSGKSEEAALDAMRATVDRYAEVADEAGVAFPPTRGATFDIVERVEGSGATDFGVPAAIAPCDRARLTARDAARLVDILQASWRVFERVAAGAPAELRKGPRGGGRDRDAIVAHVIGAEGDYARRLGIRGLSGTDSEVVEKRREAMVQVISRARTGDLLVEKGWTARYGARRITWHVLDHAWEIEDRSRPV